MQPRVIILGAGPVGLGAALELARFGVSSIVIEKHTGTSWHPKTRNFCTRTMEIAQGWGRPVYERLRAIDTPPGWKTPIRFLTSATGEEYGRIDSQGFVGPGPEVSPALPIMSSQERIEQILVDAARLSGHVELRFGTRGVKLVEGGEEGATRAILEVENIATGERELVEGVAIVAADGAQSLLREELGIQLEGQKGIQHLINCYFNADIESEIGERTGVLLFVANSQATGVLQPLDARGRWLCQIKVEAEDWSPEVFSKERAIDWVRGATGVPDLDIEMFSLGFWKLNATVVERLVQGRAIIVGDAAHQFPPTGGIGVNTGLQGMHNAMWKLAMFANNQAGWNLVQTYNDERRSVAARVTAQSLQNSINVARIQTARLLGTESGLTPDEIVDESRRYGNHLGIEFGACYQSKAIVSDGTSPPKVADDYSDYIQSATPGCRAPHVWLGTEESPFSTLDLFGAHFVLLAGPMASDWCEQATAAAGELGVRCATYRIGEAGLTDPGGFLEAYGIAADGAVLVRPDGHVAWRSQAAASGGRQIFDALSQILDRAAKPVQPAGSIAAWSVAVAEQDTGLVRRDWRQPDGAPISVWTRGNVEPQAIVLIGHGGSQQRRGPFVSAMAKAILDKIPAYVVAIDGPVHGDRRIADADKTREAFVELWLSEDGGVPGMVSDWQAALAAVRALEGAEGLPIGYYGVSMGTAYGIPLLAAEPGISAAALGMWADEVGGKSHLSAAALNVRCPVHFVHREEDMYFDDAGARQLFERFPSSEKSFVPLPGPHEETQSQIDLAASFLAERLRQEALAA